LETPENISILELIIAFSGFFALLSIAIVLLFLTFKKRIEREQEAMREAEINFERQINEASMKAEQQERMQIAMDLHDEIGAMMTVLKINTNNAKTQIQQPERLLAVLENTTDMINQTAEAVRNISTRISPPTLAKLGLNATLEDLVKTVNETGEIQILYNSNLEQTRFNIAAELNLYRILKETINNILKHGQTAELNVQAIQSPNFLEFEFSYRGTGLTNSQVNELLHSSKRNGLKSIQSRVNNLKATISYSFEGNNAGIELRIPVKELVEK
jgi:signal transduction histidine kinase